jgi:hypothetical protein
MSTVLPNRADILQVLEALRRSPQTPDRDQAIAKCERALKELPDSA